MSDEKEVTLNGKKLTENAFNEKRKQIELEKGTVLVEVSKDTFATKLQG